MTVGSPTQGADGLVKHKGLRFTCLTTKSTRFPEVDDFPKKPCVGGLMTEHHFPALEAFCIDMAVSLFADYD